MIAETKEILKARLKSETHVTERKRIPIGEGWMAA